MYGAWWIDGVKPRHGGTMFHTDRGEAMTFDSMGAKPQHSAVENKAKHCSRGVERWAALMAKFYHLSGNSVTTVLSSESLKFMAQHGYRLGPTALCTGAWWCTVMAQTQTDTRCLVFNVGGEQSSGEPKGQALRA